MLENVKKFKLSLLICGLFVYIALLTGCLQQAPTTTETAYTGTDYSNVAFLGSDQTKMIFNKSINSEANIYMRDINNLASAEIALTYDSNENLCVRGCSYDKYVIFSSNKSGKFQIYRTAVDNTASVELLIGSSSSSTSTSSFNLLDASYSRKGNYIIFTAVDSSQTDVSCICTYNTSTKVFNNNLTPTDGLRRKPTMSYDENYILYQKKKENYWGLFYVNLANPNVEKEYLWQGNSKLESFDAEFTNSSLVFMHGSAGTQAQMEYNYFPNYQSSNIIKQMNSHYFNQPAISNDNSVTLYLQKNSGAQKFNIWKHSNSDSSDNNDKQITY